MKQLRATYLLAGAHVASAPVVRHRFTKATAPPLSTAGPAAAQEVQ